MVQNPLVSIIIPVYNEEETIGQVLSELSKLLSDLPSMEIIVIDDGSTDKTAEEVKKFSFSARYIKNEKNLGKGASIKAGIENAVGKVIVIQDADLEYPSNNISQLVKPILLGQADVVFGSRFLGKCNGMSYSHYVGNLILSKVTSLLYNAKVTDVMTGHKSLSSEIFSSLDLKERGFAVEIELTSKILKKGLKILEIPIEYYYRKHGIAKIRYLDGFKSLFKLILYKIYL